MLCVQAYSNSLIKKILHTCRSCSNTKWIQSCLKNCSFGIMPTYNVIVLQMFQQISGTVWTSHIYHKLKKKKWFKYLICVLLLDICMAFLASTTLRYDFKMSPYSWWLRHDKLMWMGCCNLSVLVSNHSRAPRRNTQPQSIKKYQIPWEKVSINYRTLLFDTYRYLSDTDTRH